MIQYDKQKGRLSEQNILDCIANHDSTVNAYLENEKYFKGLHPTIINQAAKEAGVPDNRVPVPYARKISLTAKNYLFKNDITYTGEDKEHVTRILDLLEMAQGQSKNKRVGRDLIVHGAAYKLFYAAGKGGEKVPSFIVVPGAEIIPVYDYSIEPELFAAIRHYGRVENNQVVERVEVYYADKVQYFVKSNGLKLEKEEFHPFKVVPLAVYGGEGMDGVFNAVKPLIDAVDLIISSDMNEIQRFELAYLVLFGQKMDKATLDAIKDKRLFELEKDSRLEYLLKTIDGEFNSSVLSFLIDHIHKMTGVPDFESKEFAAESGVALLYKLMGFENLAAEIEAAFIEGEKQALDLMNAVIYRPSWIDRVSFWKKNRDKSVSITLSRNIPEDIAAKMAIAKQMQDLGISDETVLDYCPMIKDTRAEIKKIDAQKKKNMAEFQAKQSMMTEEPAEPGKEEDEAA